MSDLWVKLRERAAALTHPVIAVGLGLIALQTAFRSWALYPSWFFTDDFRLMADASGHGLTWEYVLSPFDSQFMPIGRTLVWLVVQSGTMNWTLAASIMVAIQALAAMACLWMLVVLFGRRWAILAPLGLYLTTTLPMPAFMWWAAAVNQVPMQLAFFLTVSLWVRYLRAPQRITLLLASLTLAFGLLCYVKSLLIAPVLGLLAYAYFTSGSPGERLRHLWRTYRSAVIIGAGMLATYVVGYRLHVPQPFEESNGTKVREVAESMLGTTIPTGLVGGPWRWWETSPPIVLAQPPVWGVALAYVIIAGVAAYAFLRREHTSGAWVLLAGYAVCLFVLLATSRGQLYGGLAGLELRYATDLAPVLALCVGLLLLPIPGAHQSSTPRGTPYLLIAFPRLATLMLVAVVCIGGVVSTTRYVDFWHHQNRAKKYVPTMQRSLTQMSRTPHLASQVLPAEVMPGYTAPLNQTEHFVRLLTSDVAFPQATDRLHVFDDSGTLRPALIQTGVESETGPIDGCGWRIDPASAQVIPLDGPTFDWNWWLRIGYLSSAETTVEISVAGKQHLAHLNPGPNSLYVRASGVFDRVTIRQLASSATVCVDTIQVGDAVPQGEP